MQIKTKSLEQIYIIYVKNEIFDNAESPAAWYICMEWKYEIQPLTHRASRTKLKFTWLCAKAYHVCSYGDFTSTSDDNSLHMVDDNIFFERART